MFCGKCKQRRPSDLFTGRVQGRTYKTCSDCRLRDNNRRHPQAHQPQTNIGNNIPSIGEDDIYGVSDNENQNTGARARQHVNEEVVVEEAMVDDEPLIILSHTDTMEYAAHMRLREALPDNHDDIFENLPEVNIESIPIVTVNESPETEGETLRIILRWLWISDDQEARAFRNNSRAYNRAFAFTSFKYTEDRRLADRGIHGGLRSFSIHGQIYHQTGAALREGAVPRYAQLYFVGSERAVEARTEGTNLNPEIVRRLTELIEQNNPFVEYYHTALRSLQESEMEGSLRVVPESSISLGS
ncbi:unnamed protein product [Trifolium pratense]|uniref:Uncharacterized protein n=1 Tax=Trifolium pratense TaxID=57577 RepID=A0ACB0K662_TRIPR|nr:unnamed protein product [Trifolium pratense]